MLSPLILRESGHTNSHKDMFPNYGYQLEDALLDQISLVSIASWDEAHNRVGQIIFNQTHWQLTNRLLFYLVREL